jgi:putative transcriptional regulator
MFKVNGVRLLMGVFVSLAAALPMATSVGRPMPVEETGPAAMQRGGAPRLAAGTFLVATRSLPDPNFRETVVLLVAYAPKNGAAGLIINRRTEVPLRRVLPDLPAPRGSGTVAFAGGPVTPDEVKGLSRSPLFRNDGYRVLPDLVLFGSRDALEQAIAAGATADRLRVYLGYSGWNQGQLEREIARGDWHVMVADSEMVFSPEPEGVWRRLIRLTDVLVG